MPSMKQFQGFFATAETLSISKAAEKLYISTPALLQQLNLMENELGFALFIRTNKGVRLTKAGEYYLEKTKVLVHEIEEAGEKARTLARKGKDKIYIGYWADSSVNILLSVNAQLADACNITLIPTRIARDDAMTAISSHRIDCCIMPVGEFLRSIGLQYRILRSFPLYLCYNPESEDFPAENTLPVSALEGKKLLLPKVGLFDSTDRLRAEIERQHIAVEYVDITDSLEAELSCREKGVCRIAANETNASFLKFRRLDTSITYDLALAYPEEEKQDLRDFLRFLAEDYVLD